MPVLLSTFPACARRATAIVLALSLFLAGEAGARTLAEVRSLGIISLCANKDALPYAGLNPETPGFQIEIGRAIAGALGVSLNIDWILPSRRANIVNCDMLLDKVVDPDIRDARTRLTRPYQQSSIALGLHRDAAPIGDFQDIKKDQKIGVMVNSYAAMILAKAGKSISPYAFQSDMLEDFMRGELYGVAVSGASLSYYALQHPDSDLRPVNAFDGVPELTWKVAVGLRDADDALLEAVNEILDRLMADGTLKRIYSRYGIEYRPARPRTWQHAPSFHRFAHRDPGNFPGNGAAASRTGDWHFPDSNRPVIIDSREELALHTSTSTSSIVVNQ